jgi:hypothetical protein
MAATEANGQNSFSFFSFSVPAEVKRTSGERNSELRNVCNYFFLTNPPICRPGFAGCAIFRVLWLLVCHTREAAGGVMLMRMASWTIPEHTDNRMSRQAARRHHAAS